MLARPSVVIAPKKAPQLKVSSITTRLAEPPISRGTFAAIASLSSHPPASMPGQKPLVGFALTDMEFNPSYTNDAANSILSFPDAADAWDAAAFAERIRSIVGAERFTPSLAPGRFVSGRRQYICRPFLLEARMKPSRTPMVVMLLERHARESIPLSEISRLFRLSPRECQTIQYVTQGLTTKEVAQRMNVSPHTVKQFLRLIMGKMGVSTRSAIVGKLAAYLLAAADLS